MCVNVTKLRELLSVVHYNIRFTTTSSARPYVVFELQAIHANRSSVDARLRYVGTSLPGLCNYVLCSRVVLFAMVLQIQWLR